MEKCKAVAELAWVEMVEEAEKALPILWLHRDMFVCGEMVKEELKKMVKENKNEMGQN